jgi:hypothetical protein
MTEQAAERPATSAEIEALRAELAATREKLDATHAELERLVPLVRASLARRPSKKYAAPAPRAEGVLSDEERERIRKKLAAPKTKRRRA